MYDKNNIFAKILKKEIPCKLFYEDDRVFFFNDINPQAKIHILGIPKIEVIDFGDFILKADKDMVKYFFSKVYDIVKEVGIDKSGFKIITNSGKNGGQLVPHFHIHILGGEKLSHLR
jgi:histidine triad (HIT) family protein